jgi:hypothetical protein
VFDLKLALNHWILCDEGTSCLPLHGMIHFQGSVVFKHTMRAKLASFAIFGSQSRKSKPAKPGHDYLEN